MIGRLVALLLVATLAIPIPIIAQAATWGSRFVQGGTPPIGGRVCQPASVSLRPIAAQTVGPQTRTKIKTGKEAGDEIIQARMKNVRMHNALEDGAYQLLTIGAKPVASVVVTIERERTEPQRKNMRDRLWNFFFPTLVAQDYWTGDGVVYVSVWDDGNSANWEAQIYSVDYETGMEYSMTQQMDIQSQPWVLWAYGGQTRPPYNQEASFKGYTPQIVRVNNNQRCTPYCSQRGTGQWGKCALQNSIDSIWNNGGCDGMFWGCIMSGSNYLACVAFGCAGVLFTGYLREIRETNRRCG